MHIKLITLEQLLEMQFSGTKFKLVEVLAEDSFKKGHLPHAINLPLDHLEELAKKHLKKTDLIVVYCNSFGCEASTEAARILLKMGYKKVLDYKAGKLGWVNGDLDLTKG